MHICIVFTPLLVHSFRLAQHLGRPVRRSTASVAMASANAGQEVVRESEASTGNSKQQQNQPKDAPHGPTSSSLQDVDPNELVKRRNQILWDQATRGQQPGLTLMQDALSGENKAANWGNEKTIMEPDNQN